jgi:hypothetical protein
MLVAPHAEDKGPAEQGERKTQVQEQPRRKRAGCWLLMSSAAVLFFHSGSAYTRRT